MLGRLSLPQAARSANPLCTPSTIHPWLPLGFEELFVRGRGTSVWICKGALTHTVDLWRHASQA